MDIIKFVAEATSEQKDELWQPKLWLARGRLAQIGKIGLLPAELFEARTTHFNSPWRNLAEINSGVIQEIRLIFSVNEVRGALLEDASYESTCRCADCDVQTPFVRNYEGYGHWNEVCPACYEERADA